MDKEFKTVVDLGDGDVTVTVTYEMDGYKPIIYTIHDDNSIERTLDINDDAADVVYATLLQHIIDNK